MKNLDLSRKINETDFEWELRLCLAKKHGELDADWSEIVEALGLDITPDQLRKQSVGYTKVWDYLQNRKSEPTAVDDKLTELRKERIKLQTANLERSRLDRADARKEMYYEYIGEQVQALPWPDFQPLYHSTDSRMEYVLAIADMHYGAKFVSMNNEYSTQIAQERLQDLLGQTIDFVRRNKLTHLTIAELGDTIQGCIHMSDLKLNETSVVKAVVEVSRLIALFLNELSAVCQVTYYHVSFSNHSQIRPLGTKASEIADEDLEVIIGNYIKDLCLNNDRIEVILSDSAFANIDFGALNIYATHGHNIKNPANALVELSALLDESVNCIIMGHMHGGRSFTTGETASGDTEVIVCPSFIGSDPYSDKLMKGSKAACVILGFDPIKGHTETYKMLLN